MTGPIQKLAITADVTCPICGHVSQQSTYDAQMNTMEEVTRKPNEVTYDVQWTVINAWLDCGHQIIRDGAVVQDWAPLGEDVTMHTMLAVAPHEDGRFCMYHSRLGKWAFEGTKECLRSHPDPYKRPESPC